MPMNPLSNEHTALGCLVFCSCSRNKLSLVAFPGLLSNRCRTNDVVVE